MQQLVDFQFDAKRCEWVPGGVKDASRPSKGVFYLFFSRFRSGGGAGF